MKNLPTLLTLCTLILTTSLQAKEGEDTSVIPLGEASVSSTSAAQSTFWRNWTVAGTALVAAAVGVIIVATNNGSTSNSH